MTMTKRPRVSPPWHPFDHLLQTLGLLGLGTLLVLALLRWSRLPEMVPTHFSSTGSPDRWGSSTVLLAGVVVGSGLYVSLLVLSRFPWVYNYPTEITSENAPRQYLLARRLVLFLGAFVIWLFVVLFEGGSRGAVGGVPGLSPWLLPIVLLTPLVTVVLFLAASRKR